MRFVFTLVLLLISSGILFSQTPPRIVLAMQAESPEISPHYSPGAAYYTLIPESKRCDSIDIKLKKIASVTAYNGTTKTRDRFYDTLGRITKEMEYGYYRGDTTSIITWKYDINVVTQTTLSLRQGKIEERTVLTKTDTSSLTISENCSTPDTVLVSAYYERDSLIYLKYKVNGNLKSSKNREYYSNKQLKRIEEDDEVTKHIQYFNEKGQPTKDERICRNIPIQLTTYFYNSRSLLTCKTSKRIQDNIMDSTIFLYNKKDSLVKCVWWYELGEGGINKKQTEIRSYDKKDRLVRIEKIGNFYHSSEDTGLVVFHYEKTGENYIRYQNNYDDPRIESSKIAFMFNGDTITQVVYSLQNDSLYRPIYKFVQLRDKTLLICNYQNEKWDTAYFAVYNSDGHISYARENASIAPNGYWSRGNYHAHFEYNLSGKCINVQIKNDSAPTFFYLRQVYNPKGQLILLDSKYNFGQRNYDSLRYDSLGRLVYEYSEQDGKQTELFYEYYSHNLSASKCTRRIDGKEIVLWKVSYENELPVSKELSTNDYFDDTYTLHWVYTFYK
jgi:hypothetical protein